MGIKAPPARSGAQEGLKGASSVEVLPVLGGKWLTGIKNRVQMGKEGHEASQNAMGRPSIHLRQAQCAFGDGTGHLCA